MRATVEGLAAWYGITVDELTQRDPDVERHLQSVEARLLAHIVPRTPCGEAQEEAMATASYWQYDREQTEEAKAVMQAPGAISSFQIGNWQMALREAKGNAAALFPAGLDPTARAFLLEAGLLYRGVCAR